MEGAGAAPQAALPRLPPCSLISVISRGELWPLSAVGSGCGAGAWWGHGSPSRHPTGLIPAQLLRSPTGLGKVC